jgi:hypothetical protein
MTCIIELALNNRPPLRGDRLQGTNATKGILRAGRMRWLAVLDCRVGDRY